MGQIILMDEPLSNKIAAGEVVERPASVVKELVENAIDAEATSIEVRLEEAGLKSIRVTDNGKGMDGGDAVLSFSRHATSKIGNEHDLFRIRTLGFRGEALASIAAVSKVELTTSDGESPGIRVQVEGSRVTGQEGAPSRKGTDISVSQLFYNTPARLKYLKTLQTEIGHSIDYMNRMALSHPDISFRLLHNNQEHLRTSGSGSLLKVISDIYGAGTARKMLRFEASSADYEVSGYGTVPDITRASKNYITVLVNGRWVKSFMVNKAIIDAYHTYLPIGRYPIAVISIKGDPYLTDVNVHPAKQQIRLSKESELCALIRDAVRQAVAGALGAPAAKPPKEPRPKTEQTVLWRTAEEDRNRTVTAPPQQAPSVPFRASSFDEELPAGHSGTVIKEEMDETPAPAGQVPGYPEPSRDTEPSRYAEPARETEPESVMEEPAPDLAENPRKVPFDELEVVGQIHGTYIVAQSPDGFYMVDQHAAQERIKYEFFREKVKQVDPGERQALMIPMTFHYPPDDMERIREVRDVLAGAGIELEEFGHNAFVVREHPAWFPAGAEEEIIEALVEQAIAERRTDIGGLLEETAIMMSCKRSIKANHYLTRPDMERLLADLGRAESPYTCPHGRPVIIHFSTYEIEKMFKRVM
ncbi:DNA mismatch repair endonuclease MutL [Edaphobacillus lindanitolerans]|uniref:DNA mismatch repair protein MutL n=1 Tax=Edaphobacillus lindanitolerans TaxID=550447 RepID=A0A1U7PLI4_9BACI|nr:DNA mismatch repair endonuclease MutL [Edaphobacillus lindanitolerans]SIT67000.1 DNA mismatch repair protein MutL [Edaphobacillus lindanitolerans]